MDTSWHQEKGERFYIVEIRHYTHTIYQREQFQGKSRVVVKAPAHRPKLAAVAAGFPKSSKTVATGWYTNQLEFRELPEGTTKRNWTEWHVLADKATANECQQLLNQWDKPKTSPVPVADRLLGIVLTQSKPKSLTY